MRRLFVISQLWWWWQESKRRNSQIIRGDYMSSRMCLVRLQKRYTTLDTHFRLNRSKTEMVNYISQMRVVAFSYLE
jgi:hypothetical protein